MKKTYRGLSVLFTGFTLIITGYSGCSGGSDTPFVNTPNDPGPGGPRANDGTDADQDGYKAEVDCNDQDASIHPDAKDLVRDGIDQNCSGADRLLLKSVEKVDSNGDGPIDQTITSTYEYGPESTKVTRETDSDLDGTADKRVVRIIDAQSRTQEVSTDDLDDSKPPSRETFVYNEDGLLSTNTLINEFGAIQQVDTYAYDDKKNVTTVTSTNPSTAITTILTNHYVYGFNGHADWIATKTVDNETDGTPDSITIYEYNEQGKITKESLDSNADHTFDRRATYQFNGEGRVIEIQYDSNLDDSPETIVSITYNAGGALSQTAQDSASDGLGAQDTNGTPDALNRSTYDDESDRNSGKASDFRDATYGDNAPDSQSTFENTYSE